MSLQSAAMPSRACKSERSPRTNVVAGHPASRIACKQHSDIRDVGETADELFDRALAAKVKGLIREEHLGSSRGYDDDAPAVSQPRRGFLQREKDARESYALNAFARKGDLTVGVKMQSGL
jgi:hypothetical protein